MQNLSTLSGVSQIFCDVYSFGLLCDRLIGALVEVSTG